MPRLAASVTMMFNEWRLLDRFEQAARAGFAGIEVQDPYSEPKERIADRVRAYGLAPTLMNAAPAVGAVPGREDEYRKGLERAFDYAAAAGCRQLHCLAGCTEAPDAKATFVANLKWAAAAAPAGMRLLVEPLNTRDNPGYFLTGSAQARQILDRVGADNVFLQYDFYHMQISWRARSRQRSAPTSTSSRISRWAAFPVGTSRTRRRRSTTRTCSIS